MDPRLYVLLVFPVGIISLILLARYLRPARFPGYADSGAKCLQHGPRDLLLGLLQLND